MTEDGQPIVFQQEEGDGDGQYSLIDPDVRAQLQSGQVDFSKVLKVKTFHFNTLDILSRFQSQTASAGPGDQSQAESLLSSKSSSCRFLSFVNLCYNERCVLQTGQTTFVQENEDGTTTVVTDPQLIAAALAQTSG